MALEPMTPDGAVTAAEAALGADAVLVDGTVTMVYVRVRVRESNGNVVERERLWGVTTDSDSSWLKFDGA